MAYLSKSVGRLGHEKLYPICRVSWGFGSMLGLYRDHDTPTRLKVTDSTTRPSLSLGKL